MNQYTRPAETREDSRAHTEAQVDPTLVRVETALKAAMTEVAVGVD